MLLLRSLLIILLIFSRPLLADDIYVAVASNFANPIKNIAQAFEKKENIKVRIALASSGKHVAQIKHGAPFHIFLSADQSKPQALIDAGYATEELRFTYATGALVAVSRGKSDASVEQQLQTDQYKKLALANPKLAPYGMAALEVLQHLALDKSSRSRWIMGENIAQTYQFFSTGNADIAFIALSQLHSHPKRMQQPYWLIPETLYTPIRQDAVLLRAAMDNPAAVKFFHFLQSAEVAEIIQRHGYKTAVTATTEALP